MKSPSTLVPNLPPEQEAIRAKCFHPSGMFIEFPEHDLKQSIPARFEKIARLYPDRLAVKMGDRALTYDELNRAANRIAHAIQGKCGQGSEPVALLVDRSSGTITSCLGILKAGKILVALDSSAPRSRVAYALGDSRADVVVCDSINLSLAKAMVTAERQLIDIDAVDGNLSESNLEYQISPDTISQIAYTSGSTGKPKGVFRSHRRVLHDVMTDVNASHICSEDRIIQLRQLTFGAGITHLLRALLSGASIFPYDIKNQGLASLADFLVRQEITIYASSASIFRYLTGHLNGATGNFPFIRIIYLGGEPVTTSDVEAYKTHFSETCVLLHRFSATEAGALCHYFIGKKTQLTSAVVPVGYAVNGKEIIIVDENGNEAGPGEIGEIAVRSHGLAHGYWGDAKLTKAKFYSEKAGGNAQIYMTGDLGRKLADGCLIHLGRKDFQVKIRGYRVDTVEIERALLAHRQLKDARIVAWDNEAGEKHLVAYVVPRDNLGPKVEELRAFLKEKLPDYMIPSNFMFLESLPLTNGKLDRTALPKPDHRRPDLGELYVAARTETERKLVEIWEEVLDIRPIGIHDKFFDLGGHSLLVAKLMIGIQRDFQINLPIHLLAECPTIAQLAARIEANDEQLLGKQSYTYLVKLQSEQGRVPVFCFSHAGNFRGDLLRFAQLNRLVGSEYSFYGIQARGFDGKSSPHASVEDMAAAYIEEIQTIQPRGPYFLIGECGARPIAYETAQQLHAQGEKIGLLTFLDGKILQRTFQQYFWRQYIWRRYIPGLSYQIGQIVDSWENSYTRARLAYHVNEIRRLEGHQRSRYILALVGKLSRAISAHFHSLSLPQKAFMTEDVASQPTSVQAYRNLEAYSFYSIYKRALYGYRHRPYAGKITIIANEQWHNPTLGWTDLAVGGLEVYKIPGDHDTYITKNIHLVAQRLQECLEKAKG